MSSGQPKLILPRSAFPRPRKQTDTEGFFYALQDLTGQQIEVVDLIHELAKLRRSDVFRWIAGLTAIISKQGGMELRNQMGLAAQLLPEQTWKAVEAKLKADSDPAGRLFHGRQLLFLMQMAILSSKETTEACDEDVLRRSIGLCCLMASDILKQIEQVHAPEPTGPEDAWRWLAVVLITYLDPVSEPERVGRAEAFWFESLIDQTVARHAKELTFPPTFEELFRQKHEISLREFLLILTTLYARFLMSIDNDERPAPLLLDPETMLGQHFEKSDLARVLDLISIRVEDCGPYLFGTPRQSWATDFTPLVRSPLIQVLPGKYVCPDLSALPRFFTDGVFRLLRDACDGRDFGQLFGHVFAWYVERLTARFTSGEGELAHTLYAKPCMKGTREEACDQALVWTRTAVLLEVKAGLLTARHKFASQFDETMKAIDDLLGRFGKKNRKGIGQLATTFEHLAGASTLAAGNDVLPLDGIALLIPAIIVYDERLGNHAVREYLNQKLIAALDAKNIDRSKIGHFLLFTLKDWEAFERLAPTVGAEALMNAYHDYVILNPKSRNGMFHIYAMNHYTDQQYHVGLTMEFTARAMEAVRQTLESRAAASRSD